MFKLSILFTFLVDSFVEKVLKIGFGPIIVGIIVLIFGIIFHLQGHSVVGPESSFMYANPDWIDYGMIIAVFGGIIVAGGIVIMFVRKSSS